MHLPEKQEEYVPEAGARNFSIHALSDALMALEAEMTVVHPPSKEYALLLEEMMVDHPGCPRPPTFSWNAGMVMHVLKGEPSLRDLEHVQVDGYGTAYLFFFDKQGHKGLMYDAAQTLRTHVVEAFFEWISHSAHFAIIPLPLVEGWCWTVTISERLYTAVGGECPNFHGVPGSDAGNERWPCLQGADFLKTP